MLCNSLFITNGNLLQRIEERLYFFIRKSSNSLSCIFCPSRFLQKRLLRRSWLESGHGWLAPRVAIGCHRFLVQPARFQRGRACSTIIARAISTSWTDLHYHCENIFNLMLFQLRDENENFSYSISHIETRIFWHLISGFETRSRKILLQSRSSRRDRDLLSSFSGFQTRTRIFLIWSQFSRREEGF